MAETRPEMMPWESASLKNFRRTSVIAFNNARLVVQEMEAFLSMGGARHAIPSHHYPPMLNC